MVIGIRVCPVEEDVSIVARQMHKVQIAATAGKRGKEMIATDADVTPRPVLFTWALPLYDDKLMLSKGDIDPLQSFGPN